MHVHFILQKFKVSLMLCFSKNSPNKALYLSLYPQLVLIDFHFFSPGFLLLPRSFSVLARSPVPLWMLWGFNSFQCVTAHFCCHNTSLSKSSRRTGPCNIKPIIIIAGIAVAGKHNVFIWGKKGGGASFSTLFSPVVFNIVLVFWQWVDVNEQHKIWLAATPKNRCSF